jgi:hypothetical protein
MSCPLASYPPERQQLELSYKIPRENNSLNYVFLYFDINKTDFLLLIEFHVVFHICRGLFVEP